MSKKGFKSIIITLSLIMVLALLVGCAPAATTPAPSPAPTTATTPAATQPAATTPTASPTPTTPTGYPIQQPKVRFKIATTTSLYDTGLWAYLEPAFEKKENVELDIVYAGTGAAINQGKAGNVDAVIVHDPDQEKPFVEEGWGINKRSFAYNFFMIAGPAADPAGIKDMAPVDAFKKIAAAGKNDPTNVKFISRGDNSGTHGAERRLWASAGFDYATQVQKQAWYVEAGQGMGPTLTMANEMKAYVLCDGSTFQSYKGRLALVALVQKAAAETLNVYSVYAVNPAKVRGARLDIAKKFINWLISPEVQNMIGEYGVKEFGGPLFFPIADPTFPAIPDLAENMKPIP
ncbi:MAG TPA: substrate-binding domain-containing protein [Dehalococcoidales bacterium]|nr:substrate-binding domain-containing protein [Dehalococcoidales bacterium]